ncbi:hypothetical protein V8C42DRAFT_330630 [Trichoderma barbatum]
MARRRLVMRVCVAGCVGQRRMELGLRVRRGRPQAEGGVPRAGVHHVALAAISVHLSLSLSLSISVSVSVSFSVSVSVSVSVSISLVVAAPVHHRRSEARVHCRPRIRQG